jgi:hypothetical protein
MSIQGVLPSESCLNGALKPEEVPWNLLNKKLFTPVPLIPNPLTSACLGASKRPKRTTTCRSVAAAAQAPRVNSLHPQLQLRAAGAKCHISGSVIPLEAPFREERSVSASAIPSP